MSLTIDRRVAIEQLIARGWTEERIALHLGVRLRAVQGVRSALDALATADVFAPFDPHVPRDHCARGHALTDDNVYRRADGNGRECRTCRRARDRKRQGAA